jgi:hypothetical protein
MIVPTQVHMHWYLEVPVDTDVKHARSLHRLTGLQPQQSMAILLQIFAIYYLFNMINIDFGLLKAVVCNAV